MSYKFNSIVNKSEADALKDMIFRRVKERSQGVQAEVQSDVMDMARDSFVSKDNPFSRIVGEPKVEETLVEEPVTSATGGDDGIGFPQREIKSGMSGQSRIIKEQLATAEIASNMQEARAGLSTKTSFMGALNFLNSQAAISLIRTRADKFEVVA